MNDAYRAVNMLLEYIRKLNAPTIPKLQIETDLIRIKRFLVAPCSHEVQDSILIVILKLLASVQEETCVSNGGGHHLKEMVQLVHQLAEKTSEVRDDH